MKPFVIAASLAACLTLTACGDAPEQPAEAAAPVEQAAPTPAPAPEPTPAVDNEPEPEAPAMTIEVPADAVIPGTDTTVQDAMQSMQDQVEQLELTDAEKLQAVADAREQAEAAAKSAGLNDEQVKQAGDAAEQAAKAMFGIQ